MLHSVYSSRSSVGGIVVGYLGGGGNEAPKAPKTMRPEGPKVEAEGRDRGGVLGEGGGSPPARQSGERCKLPSGVWGGAPAEIEFWLILA